MMKTATGAGIVGVSPATATNPGKGRGPAALAAPPSTLEGLSAGPKTRLRAPLVSRQSPGIAPAPVASTCLS